MERTVFLLLALCFSCAYSLCTSADNSSLTTCTTAFKTSVGSSSNCTQLNTTAGCNAYSSLVVCVNDKHINNATCGIISKVNELLNVTCKIANLKTNCPNVTVVINETPFTTTLSTTTLRSASISTSFTTTMLRSTQKELSSTSKVLKPEITMMFLFVSSLVFFNKLLP